MGVYSPTAVQLGNITLPADGESIEAADVNVPLQAIADGLVYEAGVRAAANTAESARTTPLADLTALAAITTPTDGLVRHVLGFGFYVFKTSATTGLSPFRVAAGDATAGGWVSSTAHETTRTVLVSIADLPSPWTCGLHSPQNFAPIGSLYPLTGGATTDALFTGVYFQHRQSVDATGAATARALRWPVSDFLINGATLTSVTLRMLGASGHSALPLQLPKIGIQRMDGDGVTTTLLSTGSGLASDTSANIAAYKLLHNVTFTPDQNNVIDKSLYSYAFWYWDECNTNAVTLQQLYSLAFSFTAIPDARRA